VIPDDDLREATETIEQQLIALGCDWIVEFVNAQEKESEAFEVLVERAPRFRPSRATKKSPELGDSIDLVHVAHRRLLLLIIAIQTFCISPFHWVKQAHLTLMEDSEHRVEGTDILELVPLETALVRELERSVGNLGRYLVENLDDAAAAELLRHWVMGTEQSPS
jgi:hypothetical protein